MARGIATATMMIASTVVAETTTMTTIASIDAGITTTTIASVARNRTDVAGVKATKAETKGLLKS